MKLDAILKALNAGDVRSAYPYLVALSLSKTVTVGRGVSNDALTSAVKTFADKYLESIRAEEAEADRGIDKNPIKAPLPLVYDSKLYTGPDPKLSSAEFEKLTSLHNRFTGQRVFLMGNGPSLNKIDLDLLKGENVFCLNRISLLFEKVSWRPTFYTAFDLTVVPDNLDEFNQLEVPFKFFATKHKGAILEKPDHYWYHDNSRPGDMNDRFEASSVITGFGGGGTVATLAIQLAFYMGFDPIILIGCDASYSVPKTVEQAGPDKFNDGTKLFLKSTANDDANHFDPRYFGKGKKWHNPNVAEMHRGFEKCYRAITKRGRTIVNATAGGALECIPRCNYKELFIADGFLKKPLNIGLDFTQPLANKSTGMRNYFFSALQNIDLFKTNIKLYLFCTDDNHADYYRHIPRCATVIRRKDKDYQAILSSLDCIHHPFNSIDTELEVPDTAKKIVSIHDLIPITQPGFPDSIKQKYQNAVRKASAIVCLSQPTKEFVCKFMQFPLSSCFVSPPVVDDEISAIEVDPIKDALEVEKDIAAVKRKFKLPFPYILYPAAFRPHKNHDTLIAAMRYVYTNLHLVLTTGEIHDPSKANSLAAKIKQLNLGHRIHVLGHVDRPDFLNLYRGAVSVVFPSLDEGFGIPISEAQSLRIPVISSRCGSLADVAKGSIEIDPNNFRDIAEKISSVHADEALRTKCIEDGFANVRRFTKETGAKGLLDAYLHCAKK